MRAKLSILFLLLTGSMQAQQSWTLRQCIDYAIDHSIEIQKQEINKEQEKVQLHTARFSRLPNLNGSASQSFNSGLIPPSPGNDRYTNRNSTNSDFSLSTDVPLFTGLQIPNNIALSKLNLKAAIEDLNKAKEDISINVTSAFLQILFNEELLKVAQSQVMLSSEQLSRMTRLNEVGKASTSEVYDAKARLAQDQLSMVQAENNRALALLDLSQLLELPTPESFTIQSPDVDPEFTSLTLPDEIFSEALLIKPEIRAAQYRLEGSGRNIRIAQSAFYPQLSFRAALGSGYYNTTGANNGNFGTQMKGNFNQYVGFSLSVPIFNRFQTQNRVKTARLQRSGQSLQLENTKKLLYKEIQQAYYNALAAESKYTSSATAVAANEEAFKLMREKFENGKATSVEYNEIRMNLMKSTSDRIQAKFDYLFRTKILDFYRGKELNL